MRYEMLVGLEVNNDEIYAQYRQAMAPILNKFGGGFRYDFKIAQVLRSASDKPINRVFTIYFADKPSMDAFFSDAEYKKVKAQYFERSVSQTSILAEYETEV